MRLLPLAVFIMVAGCPVATAQPQPKPAPIEEATTIAIGPSTRPPLPTPVPAQPMPTMPIEPPVLEGMDAMQLDAHAVLCFWERKGDEVKTTCLLLDANAPSTTVIEAASITDKLERGAVPMNEYSTTMSALYGRLLGAFKVNLNQDLEI